MTDAEFRTLTILADEGPQWNGNLGVKTHLAWNSAVFKRLERRGLVSGHPMKITPKGIRALASAAQCHS